MSGEVFLSYRHRDGRMIVTALGLQLDQAFGPDTVTYDADIEPGADFRAVLRESVRASEVVLVVVGPAFAPHRLAEPDDVLAQELRYAHQQDKLVVPVLLEDEELPAPTELPEAFRWLADRQAARLRGGRDFPHDIARLVDVVAQRVDRRASARPARRRRRRAAPARVDASMVLDTGHGGPVGALAWRPEAELLASGGDRTVRVRNAPKGPCRVVGEHGKKVGALAWSPGGELLASGSWDRVVAVRGPDGADERRFTGHGRQVNGVAFSPDGDTLASGSADRTVRLWDLSAAGTPVMTLAGPSGVYAVDFLSDERLASAHADRLVRVWDVVAARVVHELAGHDAEVTALDAAREVALLASGGWDGTVRLWEADSGAPVFVLRDHEGTVDTVAFSPDGDLLASGGSDRVVRVWDVATGDLAASFRGHRSAVRAVAFSPDGGSLASAGGGDLRRGDNQIRLWPIDL